MVTQKIYTESLASIFSAEATGRIHQTAYVDVDREGVALVADGIHRVIPMFVLRLLMKMPVRPVQLEDGTAVQAKDETETENGAVQMSKGASTTIGPRAANRAKGVNINAPTNPNFLIFFRKAMLTPTPRATIATQERRH